MMAKDHAISHIQYAFQMHIECHYIGHIMAVYDQTYSAHFAYCDVVHSYSVLALGHINQV